MNFIKKETVTLYHFTLTELEKLALVGILAELDQKKELKVTDEKSMKWVRELLHGFNITNL